MLHKRLGSSFFFLFLCISAFILKPKTYKVQSYLSTCSDHEIPEVNTDKLMLMYFFIMRHSFRKHELHPVSLIYLSSFWCTLRHQYVIKILLLNPTSQPTPVFYHLADCSHHTAKKHKKKYISASLLSFFFEALVMWTRHCVMLTKTTEFRVEEELGLRVSRLIKDKAMTLKCKMFFFFKKLDSTFICQH